ncbi:hypothetical protein FORC066_4087 [Yersinia enterocolitica]|nr:hypothetical protein FORC065_0441 [Yersinia enterocolitica]UXD31290.1 hypothetical protein FORC066_4087 [Yersinia enterocolitica]
MVQAHVGFLLSNQKWSAGYYSQVLSEFLSFSLLDDGEIA